MLEVAIFFAVIALVLIMWFTIKPAPDEADNDVSEVSRDKSGDDDR